MPEAASQLPEFIERRPATDRDNARLWTRADHIARLRALELDSFANIWNLQGDLVNPLQQNGAGWRSVLRLSDPAGGNDLFIKRQQNQPRRSWRFPLGAPAFRHEFEMARQCAALSLCHPPILYGERDGELGKEALLISEALPGRFKSLQQLLAEYADKPADLLPAMQQLGTGLARMHQQRVQFGALTTAHIWIDTGHGESRLINWSHARYRRSARVAMSRDYKCLLRSGNRPGAALVEAVLAEYPASTAPVRQRILRQLNHST